MWVRLDRGSGVWNFRVFAGVIAFVKRGSAARRDFTPSSQREEKRGNIVIGMADQLATNWLAMPMTMFPIS